VVIVSRIKSPQDKKNASLEHDRRNTYGENAKSSRKNIPRSKQLSHQAERRAAKTPLVSLKENVEEDAAVAAELKVREQVIEKKRKGFKKKPDSPLKEVLPYKQTGRTDRGTEVCRKMTLSNLLY
jgi:hypothetical protein